MLKYIFAAVLLTGMISTSDAALAKSLMLKEYTSVDSVKILYSLFSEYFKNHDYESAIPYGWRVLANDTANTVTKWTAAKMEEALTYIHDSTKADDARKAMIADTIMYIYDLGIKFDVANAAYYKFRKAYVLDFWKKTEVPVLIKYYEEAIAADSGLSSYYYDRLGKFYKLRMNDDPDAKTKALDLYSYLATVEPTNPAWNQELEGLVENIDELIAIRKKNWDFDKENLGKAWNYATLCLKAKEWEKAKEALEFLTQKSPETINYWSQLGTVYTKLNESDKAIATFTKLIELEPDKKEHYSNRGLAYKEKGLLSQARTDFRKASQVGGNWALPIYYEGLLYEQSARQCGFDFETKLVYLLAMNTYNRAVAMDPNLSEAKERAAAVSGSVPTQEEFFFKKIAPGTQIPISGGCFGWIGMSVTSY